MTGWHPQAQRRSCSTVRCKNYFVRTVYDSNCLYCCSSLWPHCKVTSTYVDLEFPRENQHNITFPRLLRLCLLCIYGCFKSLLLSGFPLISPYCTAALRQRPFKSACKMHYIFTYHTVQNFTTIIEGNCLRLRYSINFMCRFEV